MVLVCILVCRNLDFQTWKSPGIVLGKVLESPGILQVKKSTNPVNTQEVTPTKTYDCYDWPTFLMMKNITQLDRCLQKSVTWFNAMVLLIAVREFLVLISL